MTSLITHGKTPRDRLLQAEAILSDKVNGMPVSAIMEKYDISQPTVYRRIQQAIDYRIPENVDQLREEQNAILDELMVDMAKHREAADALIQLGITHEDIAVIDRGMAQRAKAVEMKIRIADRRAKLNGLDAPVKVDANVTVTTPLDTAINDLVNQLDAADEDVDAPAPS